MTQISAVKPDLELAYFVEHVRVLLIDHLHDPEQISCLISLTSATERCVCVCVCVSACVCVPSLVSIAIIC